MTVFDEMFMWMEMELCNAELQNDLLHWIQLKYMITFTGTYVQLLIRTKMRNGVENELECVDEYRCKNEMQFFVNEDSIRWNGWRETLRYEYTHQQNWKFSLKSSKNTKVTRLSNF